jgi:hypothetical protein
MAKNVGHRVFNSLRQIPQLGLMFSQGMIADSWGQGPLLSNHGRYLSKLELPLLSHKTLLPRSLLALQTYYKGCTWAMSGPRSKLKYYKR